MVVLRTQSEFGHAPPPQTPYSIISNLPGWDMLERVRDGDMSSMAKAVHIYPRFGPTFAAKEVSRKRCSCKRQLLGKLANARDESQLVGEVAKKVGLGGKGCLVYLNPTMWSYTSSHVHHPQRKEHAISANDLTFKVVDVAGHRLYAVLYEPQHAKALLRSWGTPGIGISIRGAERLLKGMETAIEVPYRPGDDAPEPTWTPEGPEHDLLRQRIVNILHHGAIHPQKVKCQPRDVFLYPSGMGAVFHSKNSIQEYIPGGTNVELGVVFHNTHELLYEESPSGWKLFGTVDKEGLDILEAWLAAGAKVSYTIVEFPGNPTLESVDLQRLKQLV